MFHRQNCNSRTSVTVSTVFFSELLLWFIKVLLFPQVRTSAVSSVSTVFNDW